MFFPVWDVTNKEKKELDLPSLNKPITLFGN